MVELESRRCIKRFTLHRVLLPRKCNADNYSSKSNVVENSQVDESSTQYMDSEALPTTEQNLTVYKDQPAHVEALQPMDSTVVFQGTEFMGSFGLTDVLSRSYQISQMSYNVGTVRGSVIGDFKFPQDLLSIPQISEKLHYFSLFRCDAIQLTFRVNATPFQYGGYVVSWAPQPLAQGNRSLPDDWQWWWNCNPHIMSITGKEALTVTIPWHLPNAWLRIPILESNDMEKAYLARVKVTTVSTLASSTPSGPTTIPVTMFASFINPRVSGPTPGVVVESGNAFVGEAQMSGRRAHREAVDKSESGTLTTGESDWENVTGVIRTIGDTAAALAPLVALLDKPPTVSATQPVATNQMVGLGYGLGLSEARPASLYPFDQAPILSTVFPEGGKMSLLNFMQTPGYVGAFNFDGTYASNQLIWSIPVNPTYMHQSSAVPYMAYPTFLSYGAAPFSYWAGSINYCIYIFCSAMQSARIRVTHIPNVNSPQNLASYTGDVASEVYDISSGSALIKVNASYCAPTHMLMVDRQLPPDSTLPELGGVQRYNGVLQINAVTDVIESNSTVPNILYGVVYAAAGPDFRVTGFGRASLSPTPNTERWSPVFELEPPLTAFHGEAQSVRAAFDSQDFQRFRATEMWSSEGFCDSEPMTDIVTYCKRASFLNVSVSPLTRVNVTVNGTMYPFEYFSNPFCYWRGSLDMHYYKTSAFHGDIVLTRDLPDNYGPHFSDDSISGDIYLWNGGQVYMNTGTNQCINSINIPWCRNTPFAFIGGPVANQRYYSPHPTLHNSEIGDGFYKSFGDDVCLGLLMAPWPLTALPVEVAKSPKKGQDHKGR